MRVMEMPRSHPNVAMTEDRSKREDVRSCISAWVSEYGR